MGKRGPQPTFTPEERAQRHKDRRRPYNTAWVRQRRAAMTPEEHRTYRERQNEYNRRYEQRKRAEREAQS